MLCSECNKNPAILFYKKIENGKESLEGYCYDCAKKKGINPTEVLHDQNNILSNDKININDMTKQFETIFKDLAENINLEDIENLDGAITFESQEQNPDSDEPSKISGAAIPLGSIFSNMFSNKASKSNSDESEELNDGRRKVKVEKKKNKKQNKKKKFLDTFGTNLTDKAKNNELDIVIGREKEIQRIVQILNRRSKNNPCLIGEPGVGKTAIAQGLAIKIANQNVPAKLLNKEVYLLDMTAVIAGTQFRGQFESRMKGIIDECKEYGNIILVIDEIHNIIGAGDGEHSMNAANILKPALSNGEIQLIGTTTLKEYRKYIEKDSALERRFQQVLVEEPNIEDSIVILEGIKKYYEEYHKVKISSDIIRQAVIMSEKYIHDRFLPDKAIDILDEACSRINLENKDLFKLEMLKQELAKVQSEKEEVIAADSTEDYQKAADLKTRECQLIEEIDKLSAKAKPKQLNVQDIANVIESWTKIPVKKITEAETQKLLNLETNLHKRIIGQDEAVSSVARAIRRNRAGLQSTKRPPSFIFVGPTGVGKTEIARRIAKIANAPFLKVEATKYTEVGYVGKDVESIIKDLVALTYRKMKEEKYGLLKLSSLDAAIERVAKILKPYDTLNDEDKEIIKKELAEGKYDHTEIEIDRPKKDNDIPIIEVISGSEDIGGLVDQMMSTLPGKLKKMTTSVLNALNLFLEEEVEKKIDLEALAQEVVENVENNGIIFIDEIDKITEREGSGKGDVSRQGVQRDILPIVEGSTVMTKYGPVRTDHILFIAAGAFSQSSPSDLMPELQGRFPIRVKLQNLEKEDFVKILTEVEYNLLEQYKAMLSVDNVELTFTKGAIEKIAEITAIQNEKIENIGARRLASVVEELLRDIMFEAPYKEKKKISIDINFVKKVLKKEIEEESLDKFIL